jgi:hypothetical protein
VQPSFARRVQIEVPIPPIPPVTSAIRAMSLSSSVLLIVVREHSERLMRHPLT